MNRFAFRVCMIFDDPLLQMNYLDLAKVFSSGGKPKYNFVCGDPRPAAVGGGSRPQALWHTCLIHGCEV
jgi:hypothetical protein